jgi:hypothetical protein
MKSMMEAMMPVMMKGVSAEEKQEMMLKMVPLMMRDIDLAEMMPKMMASMLPQLLEAMGREGAGEKRVDAMAKMMASICEVIDKKALAEKKDAMVSKFMQRDGFRERMPKCFVEGMPVMVRGCFEHFFPELSKEDRRTFIAAMVSAMLELGTHDFSPEEKKALFPDGTAHD